MTDTRPSGKTRLVAALLLWGFWTVSTFTFFALLYEFRGSELGACGAEWWYYAELYSQLFIYPITFGLISTFLLHYPWVLSVHYVSSMRSGATGFTIIISILTVVGFMSYMELFHVTPTPPPWYIAPEFMKNGDEGKQILELLGKRCDEDLKPIDLESSSRELREHLGRLWNNGGSEHLSYTFYIYHAGFIGMTFLFALLFTTASIMVVRNFENKEDSENKFMTFLVMLALFLGSFWVVMWLTFITEKLTVYSESPFSSFNYMFLLVFLAFYIWLLITYWPNSEFYVKLVSLIPPCIAGIFHIIPKNNSRFLVDVFGVGSSPEIYIALILFLLAVFFPAILIGLRRERDCPSNKELK